MEKEINGFKIIEKEITVHDDGLRLMPVAEDDRNSSTVMVQMFEPSTKVTHQVWVEVDGEEFRLKGFTFEKALKWASECPDDLANLIFD